MFPELCPKPYTSIAVHLLVHRLFSAQSTLVHTYSKVLSEMVHVLTFLCFYLVNNFFYTIYIYMKQLPPLPVLATAGVNRSKVPPLRSVYHFLLYFQCTLFYSFFGRTKACSKYKVFDLGRTSELLKFNNILLARTGPQYIHKLMNAGQLSLTFMMLYSA